MPNDIYNIILQLLQDCLIPLLGGLLSILIIKIKAKVDIDIAEKYLRLLDETIVNCVKATNQTYVNPLKEKGEFTEQEWRTAKERTADQISTVISKNMRKYLALVIEDLEEYIVEKIEASIEQVKQK